MLFWTAGKNITLKNKIQASNALAFFLLRLFPTIDSVKILNFAKKKTLRVPRKKRFLETFLVPVHHLPYERYQKTTFPANIGYSFFFEFFKTFLKEFWPTISGRNTNNNIVSWKEKKLNRVSLDTKQWFSIIFKLAKTKSVKILKILAETLISSEA